MDRKHNKKLVGLARALRGNMTDEENRLWYCFLRTYPVKFTRQKIIGRYIVDFYSAKAKMVIELDGSGHCTQKGKQHDKERTEYLEGYGLTVIRIQNPDVNKHFREVCIYLDKAIRAAVNDPEIHFIPYGREE